MGPWVSAVGRLPAPPGRPLLDLIFPLFTVSVLIFFPLRLPPLITH